MHKNNRVAYLALALGGIMSANAQQTIAYTDEFTHFNDAVSLYNEEQYLAAQLLFTKVKESKDSSNKEIESDCAYYIANCAIRLGQADAENKIDDFVRNYPTSSKQNQAYIEVVDYYFMKGNFAKANHYALKVNEKTITSESSQARFYFERGYSSFFMKNKKEAKKYLEKVSPSSEWGEQATYYLGYIAYDSDNFDDAKKLFGKVEGKKEYKEKMGYYQADMNFKTGNFQTAIDSGLAQLPKTTGVEKSELSKIIGESYFNLKQYDNALPYLVAYQGKSGKWSNTDFYQLGYAYYKAKDYDKAIEQFNKIIDGNNAVAQNAYYHLGESYLHTHKKTQALNAFKNASEMSFNVSIQEDAFLNYAKLSYDIGNAYQSAPAVLNAFIVKYPNSPYKAELELLLIDSYITSKNYKEALVLLEKNKSVGNKPAYQIVTFYRGLEVFGEGKFDEAIKLFDKSIAEKQDLTYTVRATFWKAESLYNLNNYKDAVANYELFINSKEAKATNEYNTVFYNLAYANFKLKNYADAAKYFQEYTLVKKADEVRKNDAYLRLGDCNFILGKYWPAMEAYNKVIDANKSDVEYAKFQKAMSYGFVDRLAKKAEDLTAFVKDYPMSNLASDAQYELGMTYVVMGQSPIAMTSFDKLVKDYPQSSYAAKGLLRQGLILYNNNNNTEALAKFKKVVNDYPKSGEALEAVQNARLIYVDNGNVDEYAAWVKGLSFVTVTDADLDKDTYESAEKQNAQNNKQAAIEGYEKYLKSFPTGLKAMQAHFYVAQLYFADKSFSNAVKHYEAVVALPKNEYTEISLARLGEVYLKEKDQTKALEVLKRLELEAAQEQNKVFARSNMMKMYYGQKEYANALLYAEKVLSMNKIDDKVKNDAQIIIARSAFDTNNLDKARKAYADVLKTAKGELAAEALYYDAFFKNKDGKYEVSNEAVQKLAKDYSSYKYFGAKGLVLMAKNFYALKDSYQATYILDSVIKNFVEFDDVVKEAEKELNTIKEQEAKRNSSIVQ